MNPAKYWKAIAGSVVAAAAVAWKTDGQAIIDGLGTLAATFVAVYFARNRDSG